MKALTKMKAMTILVSEMLNATCHLPTWLEYFKLEVQIVKVFKLVLRRFRGTVYNRKLPKYNTPLI